MLDVFRRNFEAGRLAHAYVVQGSPAGDAKRFAVSALQFLYCEGLTKPCGDCRECRKVAERKHPDIQWLEPQKKSRVFSIDDQIRPLLRDFQMTSFQGGWKAVVISDADCLDEKGGANAILKALEEPAPRRLWLLLTAHPDYLLTTIHSRCQRIVLAHGQAAFSGTWIEPLRAWLLAPPMPPGIPAISGAAFLKAVLDEQEKAIIQRLREELEDVDIDKEVFEARVRAERIKVRDELLRYLALWRRDVLACACGSDASVLHFGDDAATLREQARALGVSGALASLRRIQEISRRLDRNMPELQVFEAALLAG